MAKFSLKTLTKEQKVTRKRIIELSHVSHLSHLGSCLGVIDHIDAIYKYKKKGDEFVLSNGHAGIAFYVILEKYGILESQEIKKMHIHPDRDLKRGISVSTGSLGQGLPIAVGMALANKKRTIYCMVSDGECAEGSIWEALRVVREQNLKNIKIIVNANGWSAYDKVNIPYLMKRLKSFGFKINKIKGHDMKLISETIKNWDKEDFSILFALTTSDQFPFLKGQDAHYYIMKDEDYNLAIKELV